MNEWEERLDMPSELGLQPDLGLQQLLTTVGSGVVLGGVLGFAAKKLLKLAVFLAALEVGLLVILERNGMLNIYWSELDGLLSGSGVEGIGSGVSALAPILAALPIGAGLAGGFLVGFKIG